MGSRNALDRLRAALLVGLGGMMLSPFAIVQAAAAQAPGGDQTALDARCTAYAGRTFEGATITSARISAPSAKAGAMCIIRGEMPQDLDFEVWLPAKWNQRIVFIGQGSFAGRLGPSDSYVPKGDPVAGDYAVIHSNHGHTSDVMDARFALDPQMFAEYAYLSVPRVKAPATQILRSWYGRRIDRAKSVYHGCSGGGRQAMLQAQRFPELFDGIIARAPATAFVPQFLWYDRVAKQRAQPGAALSAEQASAIAAAVETKCDALDGLKDGILGRADLCRYDPAELACGSESPKSCLTPIQIATARTYYAPTNVGNDRFVWPGFPFGEEAGLGPYIAGLQEKLWSGAMRYMVLRDGDADPLKADPERYLDRLGELSVALDATDPDLGRFRARGGKLLLWTGQADWMITANNATNYYLRVVEQAGGQQAADEFVEYYTSPSVGHCGGGSGADQFDLLTPMFAWLENGVRPSSKTIIATKVDPVTKNPVLSRPLCRYPRYPRYVGGDISKATSFTCAIPEASAGT